MSPSDLDFIFTLTAYKLIQIKHDSNNSNNCRITSYWFCLGYIPITDPITIIGKLNFLNAGPMKSLLVLRLGESNKDWVQGGNLSERDKDVFKELEATIARRNGNRHWEDISYGRLFYQTLVCIIDHDEFMGWSHFLPHHSGLFSAKTLSNSRVWQISSKKGSGIWSPLDNHFFLLGSYEFTMIEA